MLARLLVLAFLSVAGFAANPVDGCEQTQAPAEVSAVSTPVQMACTHCGCLQARAGCNCICHRAPVPACPEHDTEASEDEAQQTEQNS